jgi:hypothetical protein
MYIQLHRIYFNENFGLIISRKPFAATPYPASPYFTVVTVQWMLKKNIYI